MISPLLLHRRYSSCTQSSIYNPVYLSSDSCFEYHHELLWMYLHSDTWPINISKGNYNGMNVYVRYGNKNLASPTILYLIRTLSKWTCLCLVLVSTVQCGYNFLPNPHNRHPIARPWVWDMGCYFVSTNYDLFSASVTTVLYAITATALISTC